MTPVVAKPLVQTAVAIPVTTTSVAQTPLTPVVAKPLVQTAVAIPVTTTSVA